MRDELAERLLAVVMSWTPADVARERPRLQALADYKYDEYPQFSPGLRFVESLAQWLQQFDPADRPLAYDFVLQKLLFVSAAEFSHLVATVYPDYVRPFLIRQAAEELKLEPWRVADIAASPVFRIRRRQTLYLGLSDGARLDVFRRANPILSNEQVYQTYEIRHERAESLREELKNDLLRLGSQEEAVFRTLVLLDDFSGTGYTYATKKMGRIARDLQDQQKPLAQLVSRDGVAVVAVVYVATEYARAELVKAAASLPRATSTAVHAIHVIPDDLGLRPGSDPFSSLVERYYDLDKLDKHFEKGGTKDARYGFGGRGLPLVLTHNTPNDSLFLLWTMKSQLQGLFPRVDRHKEIG